MGFSKNIPLNKLPKRLGELDKKKLIITVCPHNDRASIARMFLHIKGYNAKYLSDGLLGSAEYLRGDKAKNFILEKKCKIIILNNLALLLTLIQRIIIPQKSRQFWV